MLFQSVRTSAAKFFKILSNAALREKSKVLLISDLEGTKNLANYTLSVMEGILRVWKLWPSVLQALAIDSN